jgi:hypothetical protein
LWGRQCSNCESYFRTGHIAGVTICPYCAISQDSLAFITEAQGRYVVTFCNSLMKAVTEKVNVTLDAQEISDTTPEWKYEEERQQFHFECAGCHTPTDILGDYGYCPKCGRSNARKLIEKKLAELENQLNKADQEITGKKERGDGWEKITLACFAEFEPMGNHLRRWLTLVPATPKRRTDFENLSFQRVFETADRLQQWFGIDLFRGISDGDRGFLKKMLQRRHILTHNGGKVDQDYLDQSGDKNVRLNERIRIASNEARRLIPLVRTIASNLLDDFESMNFGGSIS